MIKKLQHICKKRAMLYLVFLLVFFGGMIAPYAEIYRWQDEDGVIRYSNIPPEDESLILDIIRTEKVPLVEDTDGTMYYLNIPDESYNKIISVQGMPGQLALPPEVLVELAQVTSIEATRTPQPSGSEGGEEYLKSHSNPSELEKQSMDLKLALTHMKAEIEKLQKAVTITDIHISTLREPRQQLELVDGKVDKIQLYVDTVQKPQLASLMARMNTLESEIESFRDVAFPDKLASLSKNLQQLESQSPPTYDDSQLQSDMAEFKKSQYQQLEKLYARLDTLDDTETSHSRQLKELYVKLEAVESSLQAMNELAISDQLASLSENLQQLESQQPQTYNDSLLHSRLTDLQTRQLKQIGEVYAKLNELDDIKTTHDQLFEMFSAKLETFEKSLTTMNTQALSEQIEMFSAKLETLETQQQPDYNMRIKLAALETEVENLLDVLPSSQRASEVVSELRENGKTLKTITTYQGQQLSHQKTQLERLREEIEVIKSQVGGMVVGQQVSRDTQQNLVTPLSVPEKNQVMEELIEKNRFLEAVIKHQTNVLNTQKERIDSLEAKLERLLQVLGTIK